MSIKENQLPTAQEVTENNLIRTVNENGASQNMTVEQLGGLVGGSGGGNVVVLPMIVAGNRVYITTTWQEIHDGMINGIVYILKGGTGNYISQAFVYATSASDLYLIYAKSGDDTLIFGSDDTESDMSLQD